LTLPRIKGRPIGVSPLPLPPLDADGEAQTLNSFDEQAFNGDRS
jgi:two-component system sensor histidine kinase MtrB